MSIRPPVVHYEGERGAQYHALKHQVPEAAFPWVGRSRAAKLLPFVTHKDIVFEYGAGVGWNLSSLPRAQRVACDAASFLRPGLERRGIRFVSDPADEPAESVDVVICHHVLEHVLEPAAVLSSIRRLLKPGGTLLLFVPFEKETQFRRFDPQHSDHHLFAWNAQTLGNLVTATGYEVRSAGLGRFGYDRLAAVWAARTRLGEVGFRAIRLTAQIVFPRLEVRVVAVKPYTS